MKAILMSVSPEAVKRIASGRKKAERGRINDCEMENQS